MELGSGAQKCNRLTSRGDARSLTAAVKVQALHPFPETIHLICMSDIEPTAPAPAAPTTAVHVEPVSSASSAPEEQKEPADTGLHIAMRALLSIVAGLIVSELLKNTVGSMTGDWPPNLTSGANGFLLLGATVFVIRVLSDNLLYYTARDAATQHDAYAARIFLLVCDLASYALCYAIVLRLPDSPQGAALSRNAMLWTVFFFALVEALHALWCFVALNGLIRNNSEVEKPRANLLRCWMRLSGEASAVWLALVAVLWWLTSAETRISVGAAGAVLVVSIASAARYLAKMREPYMGRPMVSPCDSRSR